MALIGSVESKSWRGRVVHGSIILALFIGSLTMVYPFAIMLSGSVRSEMDGADLDLIPAFWVDEAVLYRKFLETKYNQDVNHLNRAHRARYFSFRDPLPPEDAAPNDAQAQRLKEYLAQDGLPLHWQNLGGVYGDRTVPENLRELRQRLSDYFDGDLDALGRDLGTPVNSWDTVVILVPKWTNRRYDRSRDQMFETYVQMLHEAPFAERQAVSLTGLFMESIIYPTYGRGDPTEYNAAHAVNIDDFADLLLPANVPGVNQPQLREDWIEFVRKELNPSFIILPDATQAQYDAFVRDHLDGDVTYPLPDGRSWLSGEERQAYQQFIDAQPVEALRLIGPEYEFGQASLPGAMAAMEYDYVIDNAASLRWTYSVRNYINVFDELVFQGRAMVNTVIFCTLAIVLSLLINPMAAYAMSRFKLKSTYKVLLFLMATMAFPPMVTLIPQFILLRQLGLLNTFIALVLPLLANGYMIFLLKGFFDSLPQELYEAARIDGASEARMFFQITMALSKPILAVLALGTFTGAYMMFLYPLLVAPDPDMWLISVWLFQYQQRASSAGVYASVVIASIPTLIIFLFAQRTIMRGIVVPTEK